VRTGKAKFVYRHFPVLGPSSVLLAEAAECAADQGKFWQFHDAIFAITSDGSEPQIPADRIKRIATELGIETAPFSDCLDNHRDLGRVNAQLAEGQQRGVRSTPTIFVDDKMIVGLQDYQTYKQAIEEQLAKAR
jgi:protein-disulfide isomerase